MTGLPAPGSWVIANVPSGAPASHTQPLPKRPHAFGLEFGLESSEGTPLALYLGNQILRFAQNDIVRMPGLAGHDGRGLELREIQVVIQDLASVIENWTGGGCTDDFLKRKVLIGGAGEQLVQVVHVGLEVLSMVEGKSSGADYGLERICRVWKFYKCKHINSFGLSFSK